MTDEPTNTPPGRVYYIATYKSEPVRIPAETMGPLPIDGARSVTLFRNGSLTGRVQGIPILWWFEDPDFTGQRYIIKLPDEVFARVLADECEISPEPEDRDRPEWIFRRNGAIVGRLINAENNVDAWWIEP